MVTLYEKSPCYEIESDERPALQAFVDSCKIWENKSTIVLDAHRIAQTIQP